MDRLIQLPRLYAIVDVALAEFFGWKPPDLARAYMDGGARLVQLRDKRISSVKLLEWCDEIVSEADGRGVKVIINDYFDIVQLTDAHGVHVGQDDLSVSAIRRVIGQDSILGLSTHTRDQVRDPLCKIVDYIAVGPVFQTNTKISDDSAVGLDFIRKARELTAEKPIVAIGGITLEQAPAVIEAGASAVAVISDLLIDSKPDRRVRSYVESLSA